MSRRMSELWDLLTAYSPALQMAWAVWLVWGVGQIAWYRRLRERHQPATGRILFDVVDAPYEEPAAAAPQEPHDPMLPDRALPQERLSVAFARVPVEPNPPARPRSTSVEPAAEPVVSRAAEIWREPQEAGPGVTEIDEAFAAIIADFEEPEPDLSHGTRDCHATS